jgi:hypothetical protein
MTTFFIDLWQDLRDKRLWPVAVGLLAAIVAVPVILFKPASDAAPPATAAPKTGGAETLPVVSVDSGPTQGSRLEAFTTKNPFKPMKDLAKADTGGSSAAADGSAPSGSGSSTGSGLGGGSTTGGSTGSSGGSTGSSGGSSPGSSTPSTPSVKWFHYTANFSFGEPGKAKKFENVSNFTLLPDESTPSIVFLGIDGDNKTAMFFVSDPGFVAQGEGECNAKGAKCSFVALKLSDSSDEETFTAADGSISYDLKLTGINREEVGTSKSGDPQPAPGKSGKTFTATGAGVAAATETTQAVVPEMFAAVPALARVQK